MTWVHIGKEFSFAAAHQLWRDDWSPERNDEVFDKCARMHGHNYKLIVQVGGEVVVDDGMVMNYYEITNLVENLIISKWDHRTLNDLAPFKTKLPTAEYMSIVVFELLDSRLPKGVVLESVIVKETEKTFARRDR